MFFLSVYFLFLLKCFKAIKKMSRDYKLPRRKNKRDRPDWDDSNDELEIENELEIVNENYKPKKKRNRHQFDHIDKSPLIFIDPSVKSLEEEELEILNRMNPRSKLKRIDVDRIKYKQTNDYNIPERRIRKYGMNRKNDIFEKESDDDDNNDTVKVSEPVIFQGNEGFIPPPYHK
jgi:hypothetical protein